MGSDWIGGDWIGGHWVSGVGASGVGVERSGEFTEVVAPCFEGSVLVEAGAPG